MQYAIRQLMVAYGSDFDPYVKQEIEKFLLSDRATVNECEYFDGDDDTDDDDDDLMAVTDRKVLNFRFFNFVNRNSVVGPLLEHIENCFSSRLNDLRCKGKGEIIFAQVAVSDVARDSEIIKEIASVDQKAKKKGGLRAWFDVSYCMPKSDDETDANVPVVSTDFEMLQGFYFIDFLTVSYDPIIWNGSFTIVIRGNEILLTSPPHHFSVRAIDIDGPVLMDDTRRSFEMYLNLRIPPCYYTNNDLDHFDFTNRSFNLSLKRNRPVQSEMSWRLRCAFQQLGIEVCNVFNLRQLKLEVNQTDKGSSNDFTANYLIKTWHSTHAAVLPPILPDRILSQFHECASVTELMLLLDSAKPERFRKLHIDPIANCELPFPECSPQPDNYALCGRVKVTPNRFIFTGLEPIPINRVYRYFPNPENFLLVSFGDEHGENPWRSENVCEWFLSVLQNGIEVAGKCYTFLGCSNSQLREGRCWFSSLDRNEVYEKIGQFSSEWSAGRKLTRIALAFAASVNTVTLDHERYLKTVAPDVTIGGINFSDGIGRASRSLFEKVTKLLGITPSTSALQIRVGGVKGVVSVYDQEEDVMFRKSMKKFESHHNVLEVLNYSRSISLRLNRYVILLLSSFGVPDEVFLNLQQNMVMENINQITGDKEAFDFVASNSNIFDWHLFPRHQLMHHFFASCFSATRLI